MAEVSDEKWLKRAEDLFFEVRDGAAYEGHQQAIFAFGREMADARAEEIAEELLARRDRYPNTDSLHTSAAFHIAADIARSTISKPKTREQVLEEALKRIVRFYEKSALEAAICEDPATTARNALRWKS